MTLSPLRRRLGLLLVPGGEVVHHALELPGLGGEDDGGVAGRTGGHRRRSAPAGHEGVPELLLAVPKGADDPHAGDYNSAR